MEKISCWPNHHDIAWTGFPICVSQCVTSCQKICRTTSVRCLLRDGGSDWTDVSCAISRNGDFGSTTMSFPAAEKFEVTILTRRRFR